MNVIPAIIKLIHANIDMFTEQELKYLIKIAKNEMRDRHEDKEEELDDEV